MLGVVAALSAFPLCGRADVACLCETRFVAGLGVARQKPLTGLGS